MNIFGAGGEGNWYVLAAGVVAALLALIRMWWTRRFFLQDKESQANYSDSTQLAVLRVESVRLYDRYVDAAQTMQTAIDIGETNPRLARELLVTFMKKKPLPDPSRILPPPLQAALSVAIHSKETQTDAAEADGEEGSTKSLLWDGMKGAIDGAREAVTKPDKPTPGKPGD